MPSAKQKIDFLESEDGTWAKRVLISMVTDDAYNTKPIYSSNSELYPDNLMPFVDRHMEYLGSHLDISPQQYLSNLRLMTRIK